MSCTPLPKAAKLVWAKQLTRLPCLVVYVKFQLITVAKLLLPQSYYSKSCYKWLLWPILPLMHWLADGNLPLRSVRGFKRFNDNILYEVCQTARFILPFTMKPLCSQKVNRVPFYLRFNAKASRWFSHSCYFFTPAGICQCLYFWRMFSAHGLNWPHADDDPV